MGQVVRGAARNAGVIGDSVASGVSRTGGGIDTGLYMVFQPVFSLATGDVMGYEALARFRSGPLKAPDSWFAEAWSVGLGFELELAAFRLAGSTAVSGGMPEVLLVNLSPATLVDRRFAAQLRSSPLIERLIIEVTEQAAVSDYAELARALEGYRSDGARVAVDDAGAGHADVRHIELIQPEIVKLDRSLITSIHNDIDKRARAARLIAAATGIGAGIVAEGIEAEAERQCVTELGAHFGQGYLLGRPGPCRD